MECDNCPVVEKCVAAKADLAKSVTPDLQEEIATGLKHLCPLEIAVELQVEVLKITLQKMLKEMSEKHG